MAVTETWLKPGVSDSELLAHTPGYTLFSQDRKAGPGVVSAFPL